MNSDIRNILNEIRIVLNKQNEQGQKGINHI